MIRGELLFFLLVFEIFSFDFFRGRQADVLDFFSLPPKITQWDTDPCTRTIHIKAVTGGMPPYDIHVYKQDPLDSSHWSLYRLVKEQLPRITGLPTGNYRLQVRNEGESYRLLPAYLLAIRFEPEPDLLLSQSPAACSGAPQAISFTPTGTNAPAVPISWTTTLLAAPEDGELLGASTSFSGTETQLLDTLINTGKSPARIRYEIRPQVSGCPGEPRIVERVVDPVAALTLEGLDSLYCSGMPITLSLLPETRVSTAILVSWTATLLEGEASGFVGSGPMPLGPITQTLVNHGVGTAVVRYTLRPESNGCVGKLLVLDLRIAPEVKAIPLPDRSVCAGDWVFLPAFSAGNPDEALRYSWWVSDASIGLPSTAGEGAQLPTFQAVNTGATPKTIQVSVQAFYFDAVTGSVCAGISGSFILTVRSAIRLQAEMSNFLGHVISCAGAADGKIRLQASGGLLPTEELAYTYAWTGPAGFVATQPNLEGLQPGYYRVQVGTKEGSCAAEMSFVVTEPSSLALTQSKVDYVCAQGSAGSITVTPSGGTAPYTYAWTGPNSFSSAAANPKNLVSGTYQVKVTDANGCSVTGAQQTINEPAALTITNQVKVDNVCAQGATGSITVTAAGGTAPYTYAWTGPNNFSSTVASPQNLVAGTYQVTVRDVNGCTITGAAQTITEPAALALSHSKVDNVCAQGSAGSITVIPSGGTAPYTYAWTGPNSFSSTVANPQNLVSGTYQVTVTDANGCTITGAVQTITEPAQLTLTQSKVDNVCAQGATGSITVTATGGTGVYTYTWTGPNNFSSTLANPQNLVAGTYQVTVTDANGCTITGAAQTITEPTALTITNQVKVDNVCAQGATGSITVTASGGTGAYTYAWTGPNNFASTVANPQNLVSGTYQVTVTDANGCTVTGAAQTITEPAPLAINAQVQGETCADAKDGRIELTPTGGIAPYQYRWEHGPTGAVLTGLGAGTYRVTLTDQNDCTQTAEYDLLPVPVLRLEGTVTYQATQVPLLIFALLQSVAQGGTPPYTYRWSSGQTTPSITVTESGAYTLELQGATSCVQEKEFAVDIPLPLAIDVDVSTIPLCEEQGQESTLRLSIQEGLPPYQVTWSRGTASQGGLVLITRDAGLFDVEVRDALGHVQKRTITLLPRLAGPLDFEQLFDSQTQFKADLVGFKGVFRPIATWPHQVISWNFGDGTSSAEPSPSHTYTRKGRYTVTLTVLDESGCLITQSKGIDILDYFIEIPNVFTPNGDQLNDTFFPKFSFIPSLQLQVMNKWGELIYRSSGLEDAGWDGTVAGQKAPEGVYVYKLSYRVPDGRNFTSSSTFLLAR